MSNDLRIARRYAATTAVAAASFGLPIFLAPYRWARVFGWPAEPKTDVGLYFGRCLGGLAIMAALHGARAAKDPLAHRAFFVQSEALGWLVGAAHARGAIEKRQPLSETLELVLWLAWAVGGRLCAPKTEGAPETQDETSQSLA